MVTKPRPKAGGLVIVMVLLFGVGSWGACESSLMIHPDQQFEFAESYFSKGEYFRAVGEYERFIFFFPQDPRMELAAYKIGLSYQKGRQYSRAIASYHSLIDQYRKSKMAIASYFRTSECYVQLGQFSKALFTLHELVGQTQDTSVRDEAHYRRGWVFLEMEKWEEARAAFHDISPENRNRYRLEALSEAVSKRNRVKRKNPTTAGVAAILPGAGHIYCERYQDAFIAFLLNSGMILAAYEAFDKGNEALGGVLTFFELGLYAGNIYSAVNCAHKYNRRQSRNFFESLKTHSTLKAAAGRIGDGHGVSLMYTFHF